MHGLQTIRRVNQAEHDRLTKEATEFARKNPINQQLDRDFKEYLANKANTQTIINQE